ncbi:response regulator [Methylobacterium durans]|uniref:response regulator n=1 Tax=Methylobacterium durans TaxID=2202825 RepID=UPI002AFDE353|nr:response regulator [Methylobacterium durans]MEA1834361.1 response regulator [Methylobacterium durans]
MPAIPASGDLAHCRVLVVEDEYFLADDVARTLSAHGAEVVGPVGTLSEAEELARSRPLDAALLDINLKGEFSYRVADILRDRNVSVVFTTGYGPSFIPPPYAHVPVWQKPTEVGDLVALLRAACPTAQA